MRVTAFITDTEPGVVPGLLAGLELRHRQHAPVENHIHQAEADGPANLPCHDSQSHTAWLEIMPAAAHLIALAHLIAVTPTRESTGCEITPSAHRYGRSRRTLIPKSGHSAVFAVQHRWTPPAGEPWLRRSPGGAVAGPERARWPGADQRMPATARRQIVVPGAAICPSPSQGLGHTVRLSVQRQERRQMTAAVARQPGRAEQLPGAGTHLGLGVQRGVSLLLADPGATTLPAAGLVGGRVRDGCGQQGRGHRDGGDDRSGVACDDTHFNALSGWPKLESSPAVLISFLKPWPQAINTRT